MKIYEGRAERLANDPSLKANRWEKFCMIIQLVLGFLLLIGPLMAKIHGTS